MTSRAVAFAIAALCGWALPVASQTFDGTYQFERCTTGPSDGTLEVRGNRIRFYESACTLRNPMPVRGIEGAVLFDGDCAGEGMTWTERYMLMQDYNQGLVVISSGWAATYARCGP